APSMLDPDRFTPLAEAEPLSPSTWLVNGNRSRPAFGPERPRFGPGPALALEPPAIAPPASPASGLTSGNVPGNGHASGNGNGHVSGNGNGNGDHWVEQMTRNGKADHAPSSHSLPAPELDGVMAEFQRSMQKFLEVQRATMMAFLSDGDRP